MELLLEVSLGSGSEGPTSDFHRCTVDDAVALAVFTSQAAHFQSRESRGGALKLLPAGAPPLGHLKTSASGLQGPEQPLKPAAVPPLQQINK